jgi:hypothetical protein
VAQRKTNRVVAPVPIIIDAGGEAKPCFTRNLSRGGLFAVTNRSIMPQSMVLVTVVYGGQRLTTTAQVVNVHKDGLGIRFIEPSPEFEQGVAQVLTDLLNKQGGGTIDEASMLVHVGAAWAYPPGQQAAAEWQKTICPAKVQSLSLDGAAVAAARVPKVMETIVFFLTTPEKPDGSLFTKAQVARHIAGGFAVKFISPSVDFRRTISSLRRGSAKA